MAKFKKTEEQSKIVERAAAIGMTAEQACKLVPCSERTLWEHFKEEFQNGSLKANLNVAGALYKNAMSGNVTAQIFWCKTRLGWKEVSKTELTGEDGAPLTVGITFNLKDTKK